MRKELEALRGAMRDNGIDVYVVPTGDPNASEYVADHYRTREYVSGFTGSAGTLVVTGEFAGLWTDGRYFLQAESELEGSGIALMKMEEEGVPTIYEWIKNFLLEGDAGGHAFDDGSKASGQGVIVRRVGFDGETMSFGMGLSIARAVGDAADTLGEGYSLELMYGKDLVGSIWKERPEIAPSEIYEIPVEVTGKDANAKIEDVRRRMAERNIDISVISDLAETAWLFNLRGSDIEDSPLFYSYSIVTREECYLLTMPGALPEELGKSLTERIPGLALRKLCEFPITLREVIGRGSSKRVNASRESISYSVARLIEKCFDEEESKECIDWDPTPIELLKAVKNEAEISATVGAHLKDARAVTRAIIKIKKEVGKKRLTETVCSDIVLKLRENEEGFKYPSFPTIAGYMANGAVIHYEPDETSDAELKPEGLLLLDSGGQYDDGTTDITRTIALGPVTDKMKKYYTLVLKGHIDLAMSVFSEGTTGEELDMAARKPLLDNGLDYAHGTGHGVGHMLSVHEGPNNISKRKSGQAILPGMITSDEPGVYIEGEFGIRIENEILCEEVSCGDGKSSGSGTSTENATSSANRSLCFRTLTMVPYDRDLIVPEMLDEKELLWLNDYYRKVRNSLILLLDPDEVDWLINETRPF